MQQITDKHGKVIAVTDLPKAIEQAEDFSNFEVDGSEWKDFNEERKIYWADILKKLRLLLQPPATP